MATRKPAPLIETLAAIRTRRDLTQVALAGMLGIHPSNIGKWEGGYNRPPLTLLEQWCDVLDHEATMDELLDTAAMRISPLPAQPPTPRPKVTRRLDWRWQDQAACRGEDLNLFFGLEGERGDLKSDREREAKAICSGCPVRSECLEYALSSHEKSGVWGQLGEDERASERRRRMRRASMAGVSAVA